MLKKRKWEMITNSIKIWRMMRLPVCKDGEIKNARSNCKSQQRAEPLVTAQIHTTQMI